MERVWRSCKDVLKTFKDSRTTAEDNKDDLEEECDAAAHETEVYLKNLTRLGLITAIDELGAWQEAGDGDPGSWKGV